ncbi:MAG: hypothetical protein GX228_04575, partial [Firmicutes bacterium]|nr:hypothetical protein [Bacillota bacterium]
TGTMKVLAVKLAQGDTVIGPAAMEVYSAGSAADVSEMQSYGLTTNDLQTRYIPLDIKASNTAVELTVSGVTVSNYLQGLMAPQGWQFVSVGASLQNILEAQEVIVDTKGSSHPASWMGGGGASGKKEYKVPDYLIPSLSSHLYLGWNNNSMYPVSRASWLAADSLLIPGEMSLTVKPSEPLTGSLVFLVEDQYLSQASLHFYDTAYGHFALDLIGTSRHPEFALETYPAEALMRLSDAFEIRITVLDDLDQIGSVAANELNVFRVVELDLTSKVQALLDINPQEVFSLRIQTDKGHAFIPISLEATMSMPLGFGEARMVAPGSFNKMRFVFEIPREFAENPCELFVDLRQDDLLLPLIEGEIALDLHAEPVSAEGIDLYLNQVGYVSHLGSLESDLVVADVTFVDHPDDFGTVLEGCFKLVRDDFTGAESEFDIGKLVASQGLGSFGDPDDGEVFYVLAPSSITDELVLGFGDPVVKDGMARRAVVVFAIPSDGQDHAWSLQSDLFPGLHVPVPETGYTETALLGSKTQTKAEFGIMDFAQKLDAAINAKVRAYQERQAAKGQLARYDQFDLEGEVEQEESIAPPRVNLAGALEFEEISSVDGLMALLRELRWVPSKDKLETWQPRYAPEAVLTQRWGTEADLANLAILVLDRLGYQPERTIVDLLADGREALARLAGVSVDSIQLEHLPAVKYQAEGEDKLLVVPFTADVAELEDYVAIPIRYVQFQDYPIAAQIEVVLSVMPKGSGFSDQFSDFATILAGGDEEVLTESYRLLTTSMPLTDLSLDAVDLVYAPAGYDGGELYTVILESASGKVIGDTINTADYDIKAVEIRISTGYEVYRHKTVLQENQALDQVAHTIAINAPDLPPAAAEQLQTVAEALHGSAANPDSLSVFKWYTRSIINRLVAEQTLIEQDLAEKLDLVIGRTYQPRVIIVTVAQDPANQSLKTSINLAGAANDVHSGDPQAISAFNVGTGLAASMLEAKVIGGIGVFELWQGLPDDVPVIWISGDNKYTALEVLQELGYSKSIQQYVEEINNKVLVFPLAKLMVDGSPEIAWLEIDRDTYFTIGVLASGEHGAMLESAVQNYLKSFTKYAVGAVMGMHSMVWGVATFSLECDDYGVVLEAAAAQAIDIAYDIKNAIEELAKWDPRQVAGIMEKVESKALGLINDLGSAAMDEAVERIKAHWEGIVDEQKKELLPDISFVGGMLDAIEVYVILAQK